VGLASSSTGEVPSDVEKSTYSQVLLAVRIADQIISISSNLLPHLFRLYALLGGKSTGTIVSARRYK